MKKIIFSAFITAFLFGCQERIDNGQVESAADFEAVTEEFCPQSKTYMDEFRNVLWSEGDLLAIFQGCTMADKYRVSDASVGKPNGTFKIVSDNSHDINGDFSSGVEISANIAVYPYSDNLSCVNADVKDAETGAVTTVYSVDGFVLPDVQYYSEDSFGDDTFPMVAVTASLSDHSLKFKNICGGMKLQLKGTQKVASIRLQGKNSEKLSGAATVTAYIDPELKPAITMATDASTSVTLKCGEGVQLNENAATEFIISLPPVLFSKGFTVTVTDSDSKTYTVETDKANTVLRSSLLNMPAVVLKEDIVEEEENPDTDGTLVEAINLDKTSLTLAPGISYAFTAKVIPAAATNKTLTWSSDDSAVAWVDQSGVVTAVRDGSAVITAVAVGGVSKSCTVTVVTPPSSQATVDYVDEYGVNHGKGVSIGATVWAPVNCGYRAASSSDKGYPYGKLYQWGRKYGQGYSASYDADESVIEEGPVSLNYAQHADNANVFFTSTSDWLSTQNDKLWNSGTESVPVKTEYDPCPKGWRVPTYAELNILNGTRSSWTTNEGQVGYWFSGASSTKYDVPINEDAKVFFPAAGRRDSDGITIGRGIDGNYWSSRPDYSLSFFPGYVSMYIFSYRASGYSVRCVQE